MWYWMWQCGCGIGSVYADSAYVLLQKLEELDEIRIQIKEQQEEQIRVIQQQVVKITGRQEGAPPPPPTLEELEEVRRVEEEAALEELVQVRQEKLQQLWQRQRAAEESQDTTTGTATGASSGNDYQADRGKSDRVTIVDDIGDALKSMSAGQSSGGEALLVDEESEEEYEPEKEVDTVAFEFNEAGEPIGGFQPLELPAISWDTVIHTPNAEEVSAPFLIVNNRKALTLQLLEHDALKYTGEEVPYDRIIYSKGMDFSRPMPGEAAKYLPQPVADPTHLTFESRFQGANLAKATQVCMRCM